MFYGANSLVASSPEKIVFDKSKRVVFYSARKNRILAGYTHFPTPGVLEVIHVIKYLSTGEIEEHSHVSSIRDTSKRVLLNEGILIKIRAKILKIEKRILEAEKKD